MIHSHCAKIESSSCTAEIAQLGERQTEDLKVPGSIPGLGNFKKLTKWDMPHVPHIWGTKKPCNCPSVTVHRWRFLPYFETWRIRVSIPVPLECKWSALPLELIPLVLRTFWKPRHCMNDMWTSIISNFSFTTPDMDGMGGWFVSLKQGLICSLQSQPPIAQLVERETVDQKQNQISLGRWFKSGSVDKVLRIPYGNRNVTYGDKVVEKWHIRAFCASSFGLSPKRFCAIWVLRVIWDPFCPQLMS